MKHLLFFFLVLVLASCSGYRSAMKEAFKLEEAGLRKEAMERYTAIFGAHQKADARIGMKRNGQAILDSKFQSARGECMRGNYIEALSMYDAAFAYHLEQQALELKLPSNAQMDKESCRQDYIDYLYSSAEDAVLQERYDEAKTLIQRLYQIDRNNKRAQYLDLLCEIIPNYNKGKKAEELGLWRDAYRYFNEVTQLDAGYKDALGRRDAALEKSQVTLAVVQFEADASLAFLQKELVAVTKNELLQLRDPFLQLVERDDLSALVEEQTKGMLGLVDAATAIKAGELTGAQFLLSLELMQVNVQPLRSTRQERKGFLGSNETARKVKYTEIVSSRSVEATCRYKVIDTESGRVHLSGSIPYAKRETGISHEFDGDYTRLYPGDWKWQLVPSKSDVVQLESKDEMDAIFQGKRNVRSEAVLRNELVKFFAEKMAAEMKNFVPTP
jgi:hypothetical protein